MAVGRAFSMTATEQGFALSASFIPYTLLQVPSRWLVDRRGVRGPYALAFLIWCAASAASAMAWSFLSLVLLPIKAIGLWRAIGIASYLLLVRPRFAPVTAALPVGA
jgi:MFS family permease